MRHFLFSGAYWGIILVIIGLGYIYNTMAGKHLPVFRIATGLVILSIGVQIIYSTVSPKKSNFTVFSESKHNHSSSTSYSVVFGSTTIDLTNVDLSEGNVKKNVEVVFGAAEVYISEDMNVEIKAETVFGNTESPMGESSGFGDRSFEQVGDKKSPNRLIIKSECVFGNIEYIIKKSNKQKEVEPEVIVEDPSDF